MVKLKISRPVRYFIYFLVIAALVLVIYLQRLVNLQCNWENEAQSKAMDTNRILQLVNNWRTSNKLPTLEKNNVLCDSASSRAVEVKRDWSHNGFSGERICRGVKCYVGENLARQIPSEQAVFNSWLASSTHRKVMANPEYKYGCISQAWDIIVLHVSDVELKY